MAGIVSYGSYVPYRRLKRAAIAQVLGVAASKGERAVASFDEDSASMAVEAVRDALKAAPAGTIGTLLFATTTPPYGEKLNAAVVAAASRLPSTIRAVDMTGSVRAGMTSLLQGLDVATSSKTQTVVAMADARLGAPEGKAEQQNGDGAAAFVLGTENVVAEIEASASRTASTAIEALSSSKLATARSPLLAATPSTCAIAARLSRRYGMYEP